MIPHLRTAHRIEHGKDNADESFPYRNGYCTTHTSTISLLFSHHTTSSFHVRASSLPGRPSAPGTPRAADSVRTNIDLSVSAQDQADGIKIFFVQGTSFFHRFSTLGVTRTEVPTLRARLGGNHCFP